MKAYTVQIDDTLADSLLAEAAERSTSVEALIASAAAMAFGLGDPLTDEQVARIEAGLAAEREGRIVSQEVVDARLGARRQR